MRTKISFLYKNIIAKLFFIVKKREFMFYNILEEEFVRSLVPNIWRYMENLVNVLLG